MLTHPKQTIYSRHTPAWRHPRTGLAATGLDPSGQNIRVDYRWGDGKPATMRKVANELVSLVPDAILGPFQRSRIGAIGGDRHRAESSSLLSPTR